MTDATPPIPEEMLSAYLDDELSAEERAHVESAVERSAELKSLLDDLARIRTDIRKLPSYTLSSDFTARVLAAAKSVDIKSSPSSTSSWSRERHLRWITGVCASAAAILCAVLMLPAPPDYSVAKIAPEAQGVPDGLGQVLADGSQPAIAGAALPEGLAFEAREQANANGVFYYSHSEQAQWADDLSSADAIIRVSLRTTTQRRAIQRTLDDEARSPESMSEDGFATKRIDQAPTEWAERFGASYGEVAPSQIIVLEGTSSELKEEMASLGVQLETTLSVNGADLKQTLDKWTATEHAGMGQDLALKVPEQPSPSVENVPSPRRGAADSVALAPKRARFASPRTTTRMRASAAAKDESSDKIARNQAASQANRATSPRRYRLVLLVNE